MNWKVGDVFFVKYTEDHALHNVKGVQKILRVDRTCVWIQNPLSPSSQQWYVPFEYMVPATKLHKALL